MKKLSLLFFICWAAGLSAQHTQWLKTIPSVTPSAPHWAQLMYQPDPDVRAVDSAYSAYYRQHPFEKNTHTQNYKHWRPKVEPFLKPDGRIAYPGPKAIRQQEKQYQSLLAEQPAHSRQPGPWVNLGPFETYNTGEGQFEVSWQANVYTLDQADTDPAVLYCGTESGGVFKSTDSGQHWAHVSANTMMNNVRIVRVDPNNADIVYAGDWNRLYRSSDGGQNWEIILDAADQPSDGLGTNAIAISPADGQRLILAGERGLWYSEDGGASWDYQFSNRVYDIEFRPGNPQVLYLVRGHATEARCEFLKSVDGGQSWAVKTEGWYNPDPSSGNLSDGGAKIAVSPLNPNLVVAGLIGNSKAGDDGYLGTWKSQDGGESWALLGPHVGGPYEYSGGPATHKNIMINEGGGGPYQGFYDYVLAISPFDADIIYTGGVSLYKSTDGGTTFNVIGGYQGNTWIHPDMQEITVGPDGIWLGTDGGIDFTSDEFATVESRKYGLTASEFWGFGSSWNEDLLVGGRYHNGNTAIRPEYENGQSLRLGGAEAPTGYVQPGGRGLAYFSDISTQLAPTSLDGAVQQFPPLSLYPSETYFATHSSELEFGSYCYNHIYIGRENQLWKSTDGGRSFELLAELGQPGQPVLQFEICRDNPQVMYVYQRTSFFGAVLWKTTDGGANWSQLDFPQGVSSMRAGGLAVNPENEQEIWAYFSHQANDGSKVFRSLDGGQSWENRTTADLDGHRIHAMLYQAGTDGVVYIGTDKAVFYRTKEQSWQLYNQGLPMRTNANLFRPFYKESRLRLGTYSNGAWEAPLVQPSRPIAQPTVDKLSAGCERDTFYFDDYSVLAHEGASWSWEFNPAPAYVSDLSARNPKVVFGTEGAYEASLTITDGQGLSSSNSIPVPIEVAGCRVDTIPGFAMQLQNSGDYATADGLPVSGNEMTITAWIRPEGVQPEYTGIAMTGGGPAAGFNFRPNMELGYHWPGGAWWWSSGLTVPQDTWSYVAMAVRPDGITLYLNEEQATHAFSPEEIDLSVTSLFMGSYRGWQSRNFRGLIDEVKIYSRALSTEEIRLQRHLTAVPALAEGLAAYFQFNEMQGAVLNKAGVQHAALNGNAGRTLSLAPVGSGVSAQRTLETATAHNYPDIASLSFDAGQQASGDLVISRLNVPPSVLPNAETVPQNGYYIMNYYGDDTWPDELASFRLTSVSLPGAAGQQPEKYVLLQRPVAAETESWQSITVAEEAESNGAAGSLSFNTSGSSFPPDGQLIAEQGELVATQQRLLPERFIVYPNPLQAGQAFHILSERGEAFSFSLYDAAGKQIQRESFRGSGLLDSSTWPAGIYQYQIETDDYWQQGQLIIVR